MHGGLLSCFAVQSCFHLGHEDSFTSQYLSCQVYSERGFFRIETFEHIGLPVPTHCSPFPSHRRALPAETGTLILENSVAASQDRVLANCRSNAADSGARGRE